MNMKCFVICLTILMASPAFAQKKLLKCLGEEEKRFHLQKRQGPVYDLNQTLMGEMIQIPGAEIKPEYLKDICSPKNFSESWKLLEYSITKGKDLFFIPKKVTGMPREVSIGMIEDYVATTRETLLNFITKIQSEAPSAGCLKEEIPQLEQFFIEIKYLQEDVDLKQVFEGRDKKIFDQLKNYPKAFQRCEARLKKKAKSGSVPEARKP